MKKSNLFLVLLCCCIGTAYAQLPDYYVCDFEDAQQNNGWVLNPGPYSNDMTNQWYIGGAIHNGGDKSLYITNDNGLTAAYASTGNCLIAYTDLQLEKGTYTLGFDWLAGGEDGKSETSLQVLWIPLKDTKGNEISYPDDMFRSVSNPVLSSILSDYTLDLTEGGFNYLSGAVSWQVAKTTVTSNGQATRLVFVWKNTVAAARQPGACVDNIIIIHPEDCPPVTKLKTQMLDHSVVLRWEGESELYEVSAYNYTSKRWQVVNTEEDSIELKGTGDGFCDFYVRSVCSPTRMSPKTQVAEFVYFAEERCIDYLTLSSQNCFTARGFAKTSDNIMYTHEMVDFGSADKYSRHTKHYFPHETDYWTGGQLKTVPDGEIASVRLGNWDVNSETERIEYAFHVDTAVAPVLLLKYAVVLQNPGHDIGNPGMDADPRFTLRILNESGDKISNCTQADFTSSSVLVKDWNVYYHQESVDPIVWKDWTTVGIDLKQYEGSTLTIQLNTFDCSQGGHFGYAYFTLSCSDGKLQGINCGDTPTEYFEAPDGFNYRWYRLQNPDDIVSREKRLDIDPRDTLTYGVDMMFPKDTTCYFTLTASAVPRYPIAEARYTIDHKGCANKVNFTSTSHVMTVNQITLDSLHHYKSACDWVRWDFGDGTVSSEVQPVHTYPAEGGTYHVVLQAGLAACDSTVGFDLVLPEMGLLRDTVQAQICENSVYMFNGKKYKEEGFYADTLLSYFGCDSIAVLDLHVVDEIKVTIDTLILSDQTFAFGDEDLAVSGTYTGTFISAAGCDSTLTLYLHVHEKLAVSLDTPFVACQDDGILNLGYHLDKGYSKTWSLRLPAGSVFDDVDRQPLGVSPLQVALPAGTLPDSYPATLVIHDSIGGDWEKPVVLQVNYSEAVIAQRWSDVLAVRNEDYNGGYNFTAYQWYKNGLPLAGATNHYLYEEQGLDTQALYAVRLTRLSDGKSVMTCPVVPAAFDVHQNIPTLVERGAQVQIPSETMAAWCSLLGNRLQTPAANGYTTAPSQSGIYILTLTGSGNTERSYRIVVK